MLHDLPKKFATKRYFEVRIPGNGYFFNSENLKIILITDIVIINLKKFKVVS